MQIKSLNERISIDRPTPRQRGITLIELLVVVAIIGILVSLLLPVLARARQRANEVAIRGVIEGVRTALENFKTERGMYPFDKTIDGSGQIYESPGKTFNPGYWQTECVAKGSLRTMSEDNSELMKFLIDGRYMDPQKGRFAKNKDGKECLIGHFGNVIIFRFLIVPALDDKGDPIGGSDSGSGGPKVQQLSERPYIWDYGFDRKNGVEATEDFTNNGKPKYDLDESKTLDAFNSTSSDQQDDIISW